MRMSWPLVSALFLLAACSPDAPVETAEPQTLIDIPRPDDSTMQMDVAAVIDERWEALQAAIDAGDEAALAEAYAQFGLASFGNGLVIPAEAAFQNAINLAPDDERWVYFLALVREFNGDLELAADGFERVLEIRPDDVPALLHLGDVRFEQARMELAQAAYRRALNSEPDSAAAQYGLGRVALAGGDNEAAVEYFEAALEQQPWADRIYYQLGLAWRDLGDLEKAQAYLDQRGNAEPDFDDPLFDEISGGQARVGGLWTDMNEGSQAYVDGDFERAVEKFRIAAEIHPDDPRSWQSLGMGLKATGDFAGAESAYLRALELDDDNAGLHHDIGMLMLITGRADEAEASFRRATEIDPQKIESHLALARLLIGRRQLQQALQRFDMALELDPQSAELAMDRAEVLMEMGRADEALAGLDDAVKANERDVTLRLAYGLMLANSGRAEEAVAEIDVALDLAGDDETRARGQYTLGYSQLILGDLNAALTAFEQAIALNPDHREARRELARLFVSARSYPGALGVYRDYLERWPEDESARIEAATTAVLMRQPPEARRILEEGVAREGASTRIVSSLARLLASVRNPKVRDPERGLEFALQAFEESRTVPNGETLALCLAAVGRFAEAEDLQQQLLDEMQQRGNDAIRDRLAANLEQYRAGRLGRLPLDPS